MTSAEIKVNKTYFMEQQFRVGTNVCLLRHES